MFQKEKKIRLKGKALRDLFEKVLERDNYTCQGKDCPGGFPLDMPHHIIHKSCSGQDISSNLITLCRHCHSKAHGIKVV